MQQQAATAYQTIRQKTATPREVEAGLLLTAAGRLQAHFDEGIIRVGDLTLAATYNYKIWTILTACALRQDGRMPVQIARGLVELGLYVVRETAACLSATSPRDAVSHLPALIAINRSVAMGLRTQQP